MSKDRWVGIDFSGNHLEWRPRCGTSNVWIADVRRARAGLHLHDVRRVQQLAGSGDPFSRLAALLAAGGYQAAGIDAPFSLPDRYVRRVGGHAALLRLVGSRAVVARPFISGGDLVHLVAARPPPLAPPKPLRDTEACWVGMGVNVRSPLWNGARPGAPMTAACITLLHRASRPIWPWSTQGAGLLVEAFPAAQLRTWGLPHQGYDGGAAAAVATRRTILRAVSSRLHVGTWSPTLLGSADALDAVLCAWAAIAVSSALTPTSPSAATEGGILVHP